MTSSISKTKKIVRQMASAGIHLGHPRRNPKMTPYIYTKKDGLQIIDLFQTYCHLKKASSFLYDISRRGKRILFVGTRKYIAKYVEQIADECNSWYINKRWLGGLLTNWKTLNNLKFKMQKIEIEKNQTKKERARIEQQKKRLRKYLDGIKTMYRLPDLVIILGQKREMKAVKECIKLKIPILTILDANGNPDLTDIFIPANDNSLQSITFILNDLSKAIKKGQKHNEIL